MQSKELATLKRTAQQVRGMLRGSDGATSNFVYIHPLGVRAPIMLASLSNLHFVGDRANIDGEYTVVVQVSALLSETDKLPVLRAISDAPRTDAEIERMNDAIDGLVEPAVGLGVTIGDEDRIFSYPTVVVHPIAVYR